MAFSARSRTPAVAAALASIVAVLSAAPPPAQAQAQAQAAAPTTTPAAPPSATAPSPVAPAPVAPAPVTPAPVAPAPPTPALPGAEFRPMPEDGSANAPLPPNIPELNSGAADQVKLTPDLVERLIASWPEMNDLASTFTDRYGLDNDAPDPASVFQSWATHPEAKIQIDSVVMKHGFKDIDDWAQVANSVLIAYDWDADLVDPKKIEDAIKDIQNTPSLTQTERDALVAQVREQAASAEASKPLDGNREVIAPYADRIAKGIGEDAVDDGTP